MDFYNQILCRFQKYKQKVPPPSLPFGQKKTSFKSTIYGSKKKFRPKGSDGGGTFRLYFWNLHKIWLKGSIDLSSV